MDNVKVCVWSVCLCFLTGPYYTDNFAFIWQCDSVTEGQERHFAWKIRKGVCVSVCM